MNLNLTRKWRSRNFDTVVGQDLSIRMLKNSLFLQHYFPVYLFSGQRGCGKTTLARIFAGAVNCKNLPAFCADPKNNSVPCLQCDSCLAMAHGKHPDFIEIDAASHTGVDNVRQIIDAACLLPVLGTKKIYLIDEAHMLSKAAFNAFLKILEEPPASVFFILATTDPQKILETVVSRCFQLFFKPITGDLLQKHLAFICDQEKIAYDQDGLRLIVLQSEGSARDALNLLEQVRFSHDQVNKQAVLTVLGYLDDERLLALFDAIMREDPVLLLSTLQNISLELYSAQALWESLVGLIRSALWLKYGVTLETAVHSQELRKIVQAASAEQITACLQIFYDHESLFLKTRNQHRVLEMVLLMICMRRSGQQHFDQEVREPHEPQVQKIIIKEEPIALGPWNNFLEKMGTLNDPLLLSIFRQGKVVVCDESAQMITLSFAQNFAFFKELLEKNTPVWQSVLQEFYGENMRLNAQFTAEPMVNVPSGQKGTSEREKSSSNVPKNMVPPKISPKSVQARAIDVSEKTTWEKANLLLQTFPGTITEVKGDDYA